MEDLLGDLRILLEEDAQALVESVLHLPADVAVQLALGLSFELWLRQLHAHHGHQAFAHVVAAQRLLQILEQAHGLARGVDGAGQRGAKAGEVSSAIDRINVVGKAEDCLGVGIVVLQRNFHHKLALFGLHVDGFLVQHGLALVQVADELLKAALVLEGQRLRFARLGIGRAIVGQRDNNR